MNKKDDARQYLLDYFAQADKLNGTIEEMEQLRKSNASKQEQLDEKVQEYEQRLDNLNSGKIKMNQSLKELGFDKPIAKFSQEDLIRLSEILEP
ncbi:MAG TPA: hypothetical protein K8V00_07650 [Ligilactobacillus acidipiscis]|uniref:Uncharacterized protein n=1 Tax=Ligilactobacillus acidipiscis TaxID=89059 RepID=A0A921K1U4_9LACO|nr:hypothetical protein [Ligilactobacillus acidipiscis]